MIKRTLLLLAAGCTLAFAGFTPIIPPGTDIHKDVAYVENGTSDQTLDLYLPKSTTKTPLVIWIHGGAWRSGAKGGWSPAYGQLGRGYAVADINYRLSFKDNAPWPAQINDCKAAIRYLRANADKYNIDPDHIAVWGHSAGGHLVEMIALTNDDTKFDGDGGNPTTSSAVQCAIAWSGPTDLVPYLHKETGKQGGMITQLLGSHDSTVASDEKATAASPLTYVSAKAVPLMIAQGMKDPVVNPEDAGKLDAALKATGATSVLIEVPEGTHGIGGPDLEAKAGDFLDKYLKSDAKPARP